MGALVIVIAVLLVGTPLAYALVDHGEPVASSPVGNSAARVLSLNGDRAQYWDSALLAFADSPLHGIGPGTFEFWWARTGDSPDLVRDAHSFYLQELAELGLAGLLAAALIGGGLLWVALEPRRRGHLGPAAIALPGAVAVFVGYLAIDWVWQVDAIAMLGIACASVGGAAGARDLRQRGRSRGPEASLPGAKRIRWLALTLGLLAIIGMAIQVPGLVSRGRIIQSSEALAGGVTGDALSRADDAVSAAPWAASPYVQRSTVREAMGNYSAALADARRAVSREPENFRLWLLLGTIQIRLDDPQAARTSFRTAAGLAPSPLRSVAPQVVVLKAKLRRLDAR